MEHNEMDSTQLTKVQRVEWQNNPIKDNYNVGLAYACHHPDYIMVRPLNWALSRHYTKWHKDFWKLYDGTR